ncbi:hypothetical protein ABEB36_008722 [Hypothenemus hampei]|uniref:Vacuolar ATP synthase subunit S1 n=1 Tax=Hypothenemus hampei TaxID=57062 RepID=A0ABD1EMV5_HYPHA
MHISQIVLFLFLEIFAIKAAILAWSNHKLEISPLLPFDDDDLEKLARQLNVKQVFLFKVALKSRTSPVPSNLKEVIVPFYSSFNPNGNIGTSNATELPLLEDCNGIETNKIHKTTGILSNSTDFLCVLDITYPRQKRSADESTEPSKSVIGNTKTNGSVIYIGQTVNGQFGLLYSSKSLVLEIDNSTIYLGRTDKLITIDKRFNIPVVIEKNEKVILRFGISWVSGYWYLQTVRVELVGILSESNYDLSTDTNIMAPAHFSYHCNGQTIFSDPISGTKLIIYDLQVQIDAKKRRFGDANDCVPFTTAPIWSGLFVTTILGLGLIVALTALMDIKTMDKFDTQSTKNLGITVMD